MIKTSPLFIWERFISSRNFSKQLFAGTKGIFIVKVEQ